MKYKYVIFPWDPLGRLDIDPIRCCFPRLLQDGIDDFQQHVAHPQGNRGDEQSGGAVARTRGMHGFSSHVWLPEDRSPRMTFGRPNVNHIPSSNLT